MRPQAKLLLISWGYTWDPRCCTLRMSEPAPDHPAEASSFRHTVRRWHPYLCLLLLAVPAAVAEPLKMAGVIALGTGHWIGGLATLAFAYMTSLFIVTRLFRIVQPRLLSLSWFSDGRALILTLWRRLLNARVRLGRAYPFLSRLIPNRSKLARDRSRSLFHERPNRHRSASDTRSQPI